jgi:hypothetical protein
MHALTEIPTFDLSGVETTGSLLHLECPADTLFIPAPHIVWIRDEPRGLVFHLTNGDRLLIRGRHDQFEIILRWLGTSTQP